MASGLAALGFTPGQNLAIGRQPPAPVSDVHCCRRCAGVPVPMYQDAVASEMAFVLDDAEVHFAFAENQEQVG